MNISRLDHRVLWIQTIRILTLFILYLVVAALVLTFFFFYSRFNIEEEAAFHDSVEGKAFKPYVYRALVPTLIRSIEKVTPETIRRRLNAEPDRHEIIERYFRALGWEIKYFYEYMLALLLWLGCLVGFCFVLRHLIAIFYEVPIFFRDLIPVLALLTALLTFHRKFHVYDPMTLLLWTLAILYVIKRKTFLFYAVFILAALNKETSFLLIGIFLVKEIKYLSRWKLTLHLAFQGILWMTIKIGISLMFKDNPGHFMQFQLINNLKIVNHPLLFIKFAVIIFIYGLFLMVQWREKPAFLRTAFLVTFIPLTVFLSAYGVIDEFRIFYEIYPLIVLLSLPALLKIFNIPLAAPASE